MIRFYHRRPVSSSVKFFTELLSHTQQYDKYGDGAVYSIVHRAVPF